MSLVPLASCGAVGPREAMDLPPVTSLVQIDGWRGHPESVAPCVSGPVLGAGALLPRGPMESSSE